MFSRLFAPTLEVQAHCDLPCGVYDPAQARIEAESVKAIIGKVADNNDPDFRTRAILIKEERSQLVKHHLTVLWTDYFKPPHLDKYPQLHELFWKATKAAGESKKSQDPAQGEQLLGLIGEIDKIFWETKQG
jgi:nickel superoxide dismutase